MDRQKGDHIWASERQGEEVLARLTDRKTIIYGHQKDNIKLLTKWIDVGDR